MWTRTLVSYTPHGKVGMHVPLKSRSKFSFVKLESLPIIRCE